MGQFPGTEAVEVPLLPTIDDGGGGRWDPSASREQALRHTQRADSCCPSICLGAVRVSEPSHDQSRGWGCMGPNKHVYDISRTGTPPYTACIPPISLCHAGSRCPSIMPWLQQLGQPRDGLGHPASFVPGQVLRHHRHLMVVLAVDIGDVVIVAVVDPIAPRRLRHVHGGVNLRGGFRPSGDGVLDVVIGDLIVGLEMFEVGSGLSHAVKLARLAHSSLMFRNWTTNTRPFPAYAQVL